MLHFHPDQLALRGHGVHAAKHYSASISAQELSNERAMCFPGPIADCSPDSI